MKTIFYKGEGYNNKFIYMFSIFIGIFIVKFLLLNMYFLYELSNNLDSYVDVYNYIHNKCIPEQFNISYSTSYISKTKYIKKSSFSFG